MLTGARYRQALAQSYMNEADAMGRQIVEELAVLKPMGIASELSEVLGLKPRLGVLFSVPGTARTFVFAKARQPSIEQLDRWQDLADWIHVWRMEAARLNAPIVIKRDRTVGNRRALERDRRLQDEGLTSTEEDDYIAMLGNFWHTFPDAMTGLVRDGTIEPMYRRED